MRISGSLREEILVWVRSAVPEEACGMIGGIENEARLVIGVENELHSPVRYRMRPEDQLRGFMLFEASELDLLAIFHSHPSSPAYPSPTDVAEFYYPGVLTLICSPVPDGWHIRAFQIQDDAIREIELDT